MCDTIKAKTLLAYILVGKECVNIKELHQLQRKVIDEFNGDVFLDISRDSLSTAVLLHPELFSLNQDCSVKRANNSEKLFASDYIDKCYSPRLPDNYRDRLKNIFTSL